MILFKSYINIYKENPKIWTFAFALFVVSSLVLFLSLTDLFANNPLKEYGLMVGIIYFIVNRPFISLFKKRLKGEYISFCIGDNIKQSVYNTKTIFAQDKRGWTIALLIIFFLVLINILAIYNILPFDLHCNELVSDISFFTLMSISFGLVVFYGIRKKELKDKGML